MVDFSVFNILFLFVSEQLYDATSSKNAHNRSISLLTSGKN